MNSRYAFAVFDCDGVILQSNMLKSRAFADALAGEPRHLVDQFVEYHRANGGVSRYRKFEHYFTSIRRSNSHDDQLRMALARYAERVRHGLMTCPVVPGIVEFLTSLQASRVPCAINSGSDQSELRDVLEHRCLSQHFVHVLGSPASKIDNMESLCTLGFMEGRGIMFGDSRSDFEAAKAFDLDFMFVRYESEWRDASDVLASHGANSIESFLDLEACEW
jgi:phosphoglycolate phosphatase-like HAD superfamily hydrolase